MTHLGSWWSVWGIEGKAFNHERKRGVLDGRVGSREWGRKRMRKQREEASR